MRQLIENVDYDLLRTMVRNARHTTEHTAEAKMNRNRKILREKKIPIHILLRRYWKKESFR